MILFSQNEAVVSNTLSNGGLSVTRLYCFFGSKIGVMALKNLQYVALAEMRATKFKHM